MPPLACFIPEKGKITSRFFKSNKTTSKKSKKYPLLQIGYSRNPEHSRKVACLPIVANHRTHQNNKDQLNHTVGVYLVTNLINPTSILHMF